MFHLYASETAAFASFVIFTLFFATLWYLEVGWSREPNAVDVLVLLAGCAFACRTAAKGKVCQWPAGVDFKGRVALVVGASSGVGYSTAVQLAEHGWTVILAARNAERLVYAKKEIERQLQRCRDAGAVKVLGTVDLRSDASIRAYVKELRAVKKQLPIGLLVMAAGAMHRHLRFVGELEELRSGAAAVAASPPAWRSMECMLAANAVGPFLFTQLMLPLLDETAEKTAVTSRIVNVASSCHTFLGPGRQARYSPVEMIKGLDERAAEVVGRAAAATEHGPYYRRDFSFFDFVGYYGLSKLCVLWNTRLLARQVATLRFTRKAAAAPATTAGTPAAASADGGAAAERQNQLKIFVACTHPGVITTYLYRDLISPWLLDLLVYYPSLIFGKTWFEAAQSTLKVAVENTSMVQGGYYLCGGEYGPNSGLSCVSAHAQNVESMERYYSWMMERVTPAMTEPTGAGGDKPQAVTAE